MVLPDEIADAAYDGDVDAVRAFLEQHPERVNEPDHEQVFSDDATQAMTLLQIGLRLSMNPDARHRVTEMVQLVLSYGANVDHRVVPEMESPTTLHEACLLACPDALEALVRAGADVNLIC